MWWPTPSAEVLSWPNSSSWFNRFEDTQPMMMMMMMMMMMFLCSVFCSAAQFEI
jgi:hypothetical protein